MAGRLELPLKWASSGPRRAKKGGSLGIQEMAMSILTWAPQGPLWDRPFWEGQERTGSQFRGLSKKIGKTSKTIEITKNSYFGGPEVF